MSMESAKFVRQSESYSTQWAQTHQRTSGCWLQQWNSLGTDYCTITGHILIGSVLLE